MKLESTEALFMPYQHQTPDLDAIARNLTALDLAHLTPEESTAYEHELSVIASGLSRLPTCAKYSCGVFVRAIDWGMRLL